MKDTHITLGLVTKWHTPNGVGSARGEIWRNNEKGPFLWWPLLY